ncbi:phenylalanine--tRNA ligase subunit beta [Sporichthya polymorpha]|uniref:phenylalanine--tRNA ligase subunit beta n=1 Tax=Sporichthya polymorpha TaxID=35751 RepID=UPI0003745A35|nr:phenylalanine--tRNA ligase subunit beta [Sporichthya polymorpha]
MRAPLSWIREFVPGLPADVTGRQVAERIIAAGLEVETVDAPGEAVTGPLVVGRVLSIVELQEKLKLKKPIRYCRVDVGPEHNETEGDGAGSRGIVCGARNFAEGDVVVVALPGAVLPGGFSIAARKTYVHISDGMICSEAELGIAGDASGIIVLPASTPIGADAKGVLGLDDEVLDIAVTPDRGYALSIRGVAREVATAYDVEFVDPAGRGAMTAGDGYEIRLGDPACDRFAALAITGVDPEAPSPDWLRQRLQQCGMRPISLAVDISNYVMLELGQPTHAYDLAKLRGPIVVRRARAGEKLETLDGATRDLDPEDLLITDDSGPIGLAGVMGGASTEISGTTTDVLLEAAHFDPVAIARAARRHKLPSEASRRFERGVDPALGPVAALRFAQLLAELGGGTAAATGTDAGGLPAPTTITLAVDHPTRVAGRELDQATVLRRLAQVGAETSVDGTTLTVTAPTWRPDLTDPADVAEEVLRLEGYDSIPAALPAAPAGRGLTVAQQQRRRVGRALAGAGLVEVLCYPFVAPGVWDQLGLEADDPRRVAVRLANPLSDAEPDMRTSLLPGLFSATRRNLGRGSVDLALYEIGRVYLPTRGAPPAPRPPVTRRATPDELAAIEAALPAQPRHLAAVLTGLREPAGWWGPGRTAGWEDAIETARIAAAAAGAELIVRSGASAPWHPGRCAALAVRTPGGEHLVGHAGELHPRVIGALELPARTVAMELDLDALLAAGGGVVEAPAISSFPLASQDVALVVDAAVPAAEVEAALRSGAGGLLESIRLFDVYTGERIGEGRKSLAFALRFRAPDRTLTVEEATAARDAAVAAAAAATGAVLRG